MDTEKQRQRRRDDARLTESGNVRSEQLSSRDAYRVANQQSLACLSGSEHRRPGWFLIWNIRLVSMLFADLLFLHLVTLWMFFILVYVTFFSSSRCMLELKFAIYYRAASLPSQASYAVLAEESQALISSNTPRTPAVFLIQQSCVIITFRC